MRWGVVPFSEPRSNGVNIKLHLLPGIPEPLHRHTEQAQHKLALLEEVIMSVNPAVPLQEHLAG